MPIDDERTVEVQLRLPAAPQAAPEARRSIARLLHGLVDTRQLETVQLLVTELVTNSIRHAGLTEGDDIDLILRASPLTVRVEVIDRGTGFVLPSPRHQSPAEAPGGWGLYLVDHFADRWGTAFEGETRVWFEVDAPQLSATGQRPLRKRSRTASGSGHGHERTADERTRPKASSNETASR